MHITRRKNRKQNCHTQFVMVAANPGCTGFFDDACYQFYLLRLFHSLEYFQIKLHAYVLLPDSIWMLLTPRAITGVRGLVRAVDRSYTDYFRTRFDRSARQWSRHYRRIPIARDAIVLEYQKLIEREPLQRGFVSHAGAWRWSSYMSNAFGGTTACLTRHRAFLAFLRKDCDPGSRYRAYVAQDCGKLFRQHLCPVAVPGPSLLMLEEHRL